MEKTTLVFLTGWREKRLYAFALDMLLRRFLLCALPIALLQISACKESSRCRALDPSCDIMAGLFFPRTQRRYIYAANNTGPAAILLYQVSDQGVITALNPASFTTNLISPRNVAIDSINQNVFVNTSQSGANTQRYLMDKDTGVLTQSTLTGQGGGLPWAIAIDPLQRFMYATDQSGNRIISYSMANTTGTGLSSPATSNAPQSVVAESTGRYLYVGSSAISNIDKYSVSTTGVLTSIGSQAGGANSSLVIHPNNRFLYAVNTASVRIDPYTINSDGSLTTLAITTTSTAADYAVITPDGQYFYCVRAAGDIMMFSINGDGTITPLSPGSLVSSAPVAMAMDPLGKFVYVTSSTSIRTYAIASNGQLSLRNTFNSGTSNLIGLAAAGFVDSGRY